MPIMFITYGLQYLDKITLGYAAVLGLQADTVSSFYVLPVAQSYSNSIWLVNNILGPVAYFTLVTLLPPSLAPMDLSNCLLESF